MVVRRMSAWPLLKRGYPVVRRCPCPAAQLDPLHPPRRLFVTSSASRSSVPRGRRSLSLLGAVAVSALLPATAVSAGWVDGTKSGVTPGIAGFPHTAGGLGVYEPGDADPTPDAIREVGQNNFTIAGTGINADLNGAQKMWAVTDIKYHTDNGVSVNCAVQRPGEPAFDAEFKGPPSRGSSGFCRTRTRLSRRPRTPTSVPPRCRWLSGAWPEVVRPGCDSPTPSTAWVPPTTRP